MIANGAMVPVFRKDVLVEGQKIFVLVTSGVVSAANGQGKAGSFISLSGVRRAHS